MGAILIALLTVTAPSKNARLLFGEAEEFYRAGDFQEALERYEMSYDLSRRPALLFNIGQCYRELGQFEKAAFYYEQYLARERKTKHRKNVQKLIQLVERQAAEKNDRERKAQEAELQRLEQERLEKAAALERAERERLAAEADAEAARAERLRIKSQIEAQQSVVDDENESRSFTREWWFWSSLGVVVVGAASLSFFLLRDDDPPADFTLDRR